MARLRPIAIADCAKQEINEAKRIATVKAYKAQLTLLQNLAQKAAPGMMMIPLTQGGPSFLFGGVSLVGHTAHVKMIEILGTKIIGSCYQQTNQSFKAIGILNIFEDFGRVSADKVSLVIMYDTNKGKEGIVYTYREGNPLCDFLDLNIN